MREKSPLACVYIIWGGKDVAYFVSTRRYSGFFHLLMALTMHEYILPGILADEGQLVGSRAYHFTILCMKILAKL
jgi:hypothetical protein